MVHKTYEEINERIRKGQTVVVTAEEMIDIVEQKGGDKAAKEVDVMLNKGISRLEIGAEVSDRGKELFWDTWLD